jgi:hypothetical protein
VISHRLATRVRTRYDPLRFRRKRLGAAAGFLLAPTTVAD